MLRPVSPTLLTLMALLGASLPGWAATPLANSDDLLQFLVQGLSPVQQVVRVPARGCGAVGCVVDAGDLAILKDKGGLMQIGGSHLPVQPRVQYRPSSLPDIDWEPLGTYSVLKADAMGGAREWGMCLEFAHKGSKQGGPDRRWTTTMLVPRVGKKLGPVAHRFVGYWSNCSVLADGGGPDDVLLPVVEQGDAPGRLQLVWHRCTTRSCVATPDRRTILPQPGSDSGALLATGVPGRSR